MRFLLSFLLVFLCVFATAQEVPPMKLGGPQGIEVNRSLNKFWMSVPIYVDTPVAPLTGSGWPGAGYLIQATKNYREATVEEWIRYTEAGGFTQLDSVRWQDNAGTIYFLPNGIDTSQVLDYVLYGDTSVWHYTGRRWRRVGGNAEFYFNYLLDGGEITQLSPVSSRQFLINPAEYYISGLKYKYDTAFKLQAPPKTPDSTGRIDVITIAVTGPKLVKGTASRTPFKPRISPNEIELSTIYFRPFDTIPSVIGGSNGSNITSIYRVPGKDSIFYTVDTLVFKIKDSVGISTASNGLTAASGNVKLGGSLIENTNINLNSRRLTFIAGSDTTRFFSNGRVTIGGSTDSVNRLSVTGDVRINGILRLSPASPSNAAIIRNENSNDGSLAWISNTTTLPSNFGARNVIISPAGGYQTTGAQNTFIGRGAGWNVTSGGGNVMLGNNAGQSITTGANNTFIGAGDSWSSLSSGTSSSIQILAGAHDSNKADTVNLGLTGRYALIGGGSLNTYVRDYYFGGGQRVAFPGDSHVNFYAPSGWPSLADTIGSNFTINAGRGTGTGRGGSVIFRTSPATTTGTTLQTLTERARITPTGNLLVGRTVDSIYRLDVTGNTRVTGNLHLQASSPSNAAVIINQNSSDGSLVWGSTMLNLPSNFGNRNVVISSTGAYSNLTGGENVLMGRAAGQNLSSGFRNTFIGNNAGFTITTGINNTFIGGSDGWANVPATTSNSIQLIGAGGHDGNKADSVLFGLTSRYAFIGGGGSGAYINDFYYGGGARARFPQSAHVNFYAPSGWPSVADTIGSNFVINAGRGTGTGVGGSIIFRTSPATTSGTTLQTLEERARITPRGNLLINRQSQSGFDTTYRLDVGGSMIARGSLSGVSYYVPNGSAIRGVTTGGTFYIDGDSSLTGNIQYRASLHTFNGTINSSTINSSGSIKSSGLNNIIEVEATGVPSLRITKKDSSTWFFENSRNISKMLEITNDINGVTQPAIAIADSRVVCIGTRTVDTSSVLNVSSTTKGFLQPRMTNTQRDAITTPAAGLQLFSTTDSANYVYRGTGGGWQKIANEISGSATLDFPSTNGSNKSDLTITVTGAAEGDVVSLGMPNSVNLNHSCFTAWVSNTNEVTVRFSNYGTGALDPVSATFKVKVFK